MDITFEKLPQAVNIINERLANIERLLLANSSESKIAIDELLTIEQAAKFLNVSVPTIYGYVHSKEIPYSKVKKRLYFSKYELTEWIKSGRRKTSAELEVAANNYLQQKK